MAQIEHQEPLFIEHVAKNGEYLVFDISEFTCLRFGFRFSDRVMTPRGPGTVVGVRDNYLWFQLECDPGASFWDNGTSPLAFQRIGITLLEPHVVDVTGVYKLKRVYYKERNVNIILQNENGPCPLIALCNVLSLRGDIAIPEADGKTSIDIDGINVLLANHIRAKTADKPEEVQAQAQRSINQLTNLKTGMDVNFTFQRCDSFEKTDQTKMFDLLDVRIMHGWIVDVSDKETGRVIKDNTYNDLLNKLVALDAPVAMSTSQSPVAPSQQTTAPPPPDRVSSPLHPHSSPLHPLSSTPDAVSAPLDPVSAPPVSVLSPQSSPLKPPPPSQEVATLAPATPTTTTTDAPAAVPLSPAPLIPSTPQTPQQADATPEAPAEQKKPEEPPKPPTIQDHMEGAVIRGFLEQTKNQLTSYGLAVLYREIREDELCVFFRNNHFATLTKHGGHLFILITDIGYEKERNIVWDLLNTVDGSSLFVSGEFKSSDDEKRTEIVNTLELMGFERHRIEEHIRLVPREKLSNPDDAITFLGEILTRQQK